MTNTAREPLDYPRVVIGPPTCPTQSDTRYHRWTMRPSRPPLPLVDGLGSGSTPMPLDPRFLGRAAWRTRTAPTLPLRHRCDVACSSTERALTRLTLTPLAWSHQLPCGPSRRICRATQQKAPNSNKVAFRLRPPSMSRKKLNRPLKRTSTIGSDTANSLYN